MKNNINKKRLILWLLGIAVGCFTIAAIFAIITGSGFSSTFNIVDEEKTFDLEKIRKIYIDTISTNVNIINEDRDDMRVHFHGKISLNVPKLETKLSSGRLTVKLVDKTKIMNIIGINFRDLSLDIYVPKKTKQNISVDTTSGELKVDSFIGENINLESTSGDIFVKYKKLSNGNTFLIFLQN